LRIELCIKDKLRNLIPFFTWPKANSYLPNSTILNTEDYCRPMNEDQMETIRMLNTCKMEDLENEIYHK